MRGRLALQLFLDGIVNGSLFALVGVSWSVIYGTARVFHFAHVLSIVVASYTAVLLVDDLGTPIVFAAAAAIVAAAASGAAAQAFVYRPMRRAGTGDLGMFLVSMGLYVAGVNVLQIVLGAGNRGLQLIPSEVYLIGSAAITRLDVGLIAVAWLSIAVVWAADRFTRWGSSTSAVRTNVELARGVGVRVERVHLLAFVVGSALVGVAGLYVASTSAINPSMGLSVVVSGLIAMFLGGAGSLLGSAAGGLILGLAQSMGGLWLPGHWQPTIALVVLLAILLLRPQGLFRTAS
ncbi:branched-chain amino acid ABC transporter permease [Desertimonas flava]|uniref:branched-chain amino acid ABC transporter permease n=1 Tax=Desertimonas flava TaxID=2064846 RepID=UPI000E3530F9|nr:branched-chain amino acid ABC transporter permease [Desertimonas flava]